MSENVTQLYPQGIKQRINDISRAPYQPYSVLTIEARVGCILDKDNFEIAIIFGSTVRFDWSHISGELILSDFEDVSSEFDGFYWSEKSRYLSDFKTRCDDGYTETSLDAMIHFRLISDTDFLDIISQNEPLIFRLDDGDLIAMPSAKDSTNAH